MLSKPTPTTPRLLYGLLVIGVLLRLVILIAAENRLDADEATVGVMALDILEKKYYPFFFYGNAYNGGGAFEAYLGALGFALFGPSEITLKGCVLLLWTVSGLLFAGLCRRALAGDKAILAMFFFCVGTPFFLEWSLKARGGYAETVLLTIFLFWLGAPHQKVAHRWRFKALVFGIASGIGVWLSEMLLIALPFSAGWFILNTRRRREAGLLMLAGCFVGLLPLIFYNLTHQYGHLRQSMVFSFFQPGNRLSEPLSLSGMILSASFTLGKAWPLLLMTLFAGGYRLVRLRDRWELGHFMLIHTAVYTTVYWLSGFRFLEIPPSRLLYALYPGVAVLFACAVWGSHRQSGPIRRVLVAAVIVLWVFSTLAPISGWIASGKPRETGSWRGSWSLVDGAGLFRRLVDSGVQVVYLNYWKGQSLSFASRCEQHRNPEAPGLSVFWWFPDKPPQSGQKAAVVLNPLGPLAAAVENSLRAGGITYERFLWDGHVVFSGLDSALMHRGSGLPRVIMQNDWQPMPESPDGFN